MLHGRMALLLPILVASCRSAPNPCPAPYQPFPARTSAVLSLLRSTTDGANLLAARVAPALCFAARAPSAATSTGTLLLDERRSDRELAARVAHLLAHASAPAFAQLDLPSTPGARDCASLAAEAKSAEAAARALELRLRARLGLDDTIPDPEVTADTYRARCEAARAQAYNRSRTPFGLAEPPDAGALP